MYFGSILPGIHVLPQVGQTLLASSCAMYLPSASRQARQNHAFEAQTHTGGLSASRVVNNGLSAGMMKYQVTTADHCGFAPVQYLCNFRRQCDRMALPILAKRRWYNDGIAIKETPA